jgi:hypothetical protein
MSRGRSVGIGTGYGLDDREIGARIPAGYIIFISSHRPNLLWGPLNPLFNGYRGAIFQGVKWQGREADYSPQTSDEVKKKWIYTSTTPYDFIESCLVKHRDSFSFVGRAFHGNLPQVTQNRYPGNNSINKISMATNKYNMYCCEQCFHLGPPEYERFLGNPQRTA